MGQQQQTQQELSSNHTEDYTLSDARYEFNSSTTNRLGAIVPRVALAFIPLLLFIVVGIVTNYPIWYLIGIIVAILTFISIHFVLEWERIVVLRNGKFNRVDGPGMVFVMPFFETVASTIDMRIRSTVFKAEHVLTSDLVPVDVDAVLYWMVHEPAKASTEVRNFENLVYWVAQTTLRDVMGSIEIAQMSTRRTQIDDEVRDILADKTGEWGISVTSVEIRNIEVPEELQQALSAEARARQEYNARIILAEVEKEVSEMYVDAARTYQEEEDAIRLRSMSYITESVKEKGGLVVIPSSITQAFDKAGFGSLVE